MKFITDEEEQDDLFNNKDYFIGEYHETIPVEVTLKKNSADVFTPLKGDITNRVPHISFLDGCQISMLKSLENTVISGEMLIPKVDLKEMLRILNDDPIGLQNIKGKFYIRANDIRQYKGIKLENMKFHRRREYLKRALNQLQSPYIMEYEYFDEQVPLTEEMINYINDCGGNDWSDKYPALYDDWSYSDDEDGVISKRGYYEYLCLRANRKGVIFKNKYSKYGDECLIVNC